MAKIILDGLRYDTEAEGTELIATTEMSSGDSERLYRTKNGAWFIELADERSVAVSLFREDPWFRSVLPVSSDQAMEWLESCGLTNALEKYFGDRIKDA